MATWRISEKETFDPIHVQLKVSGIETHKGIQISENALQYGDCKIPISRLGSWIFYAIADGNDISTLLRTGGVTLALVWAFHKAYPNISVWVTNADEQTFALEVLKGQKKAIMDEISRDEMKRKIEKELREIAPDDLYKEAKVKLIKILPIGSKKADREDTSRGVFSEEEKLAILEASEKIAFLMKQKEYSLAYLRLKQDLQKEADNIARFQMLIRLSICTITMRMPEEAETACQHLLAMLKTVDISPGAVPHYEGEFSTLVVLLTKRGPYVRAAEMILAASEITKRIEDPAVRLDKICTAVNRVSGVVTNMLNLNPTADIREKAAQFLEKIEKDLIGFIRNEAAVDSFLKSQCIYYAEYALAQVKALFKKQMTLSRESAETFKQVGGHWKDLPNVLARLKAHPDAKDYFSDENFEKTITEISNNPTSLLEKLEDLKIVHVDQILKSDFGLESNNEEEEMDLSLAEYDFDDGTSAGNDAKKKSEDAFQKGNAAYGKKEFDKALRHYTRAIALDPINGVLYCNKATVYMALRRFNLAKQVCQQALQILKAGNGSVVYEAMILAKLATVEQRTGNHQDAAQLFKRSLRLRRDPEVEEGLKECQMAICVDLARAQAQVFRTCPQLMTEGVRFLQNFPSVSAAIESATSANSQNRPPQN